MFGAINIRLAIYGAVIAVTFAAGWVVNGWRYEAKLAKGQKIERELQAKADAYRSKKDAEIKAIANKHNSIVSELHNRISRADSNNGQACNGSKLPREDAEFLIGEATRADQVVAELKYCYSQYETAKKLTNN
ncbi:hypothetical protein [Flavobacterium sp.]|jgi:hypothetical protein|uniref:hypothetical protein n=1 Tax=Flavobacterium sp. TaxID=239 RepID=UPI0037BEBD87